MTALEDVEYSIQKITAMLEQDFMTVPVREILTDCLSRLEAAKFNMDD
jgi:hypothetical protein|tara:strand:+ start:672 stop:815 length:144 start_codon:yes stop_codon:yes gene_type:complete